MDCQKCGRVLDYPSRSRFRLAGGLWANLCLDCANEWHQKTAFSDEFVDLEYATQRIAALKYAGKPPARKIVEEALNSEKYFYDLSKKWLAGDVE